MSEVLIKDLRSNGVDVSMGDAYVKVEDVRKVVNWLFGEGSEVLLDHLERHLKEA